MSGVRSLLSRVARLEQARAAPRSPFEAAYGSLDAFEAEVQADIAAGKLEPVGMAAVLTSIRKWHDEGLWGLWYRDRVWELSR